MAELLLSWVNHDLKLSKTVTNLDKDFANGYLLGEILHIHNQQANFHLFSNKETPDAQINNFNLLAPTFTRLSIKFDARVAYGVMSSSSPTTSKLLYAVQMSTSKLRNFSTAVSARPHLTGTETGRSDIMPLPVVYGRARHGAFNDVSESLFDAGIRTRLGDSRAVALEAAALGRYREEEERQRKTVELGNKMEEDQLNARIMTIRAERIAARKNDQAIKKDKDKDGTEAFNKNQALAKERRAVRQRVLDKRERAKQEARKSQHEGDTQALRDDVEDFERRLRRAQEDEPPPARLRADIADPQKKAMAMASDKRGMAANLSRQMSEILAKKAVKKENALSREKRRRKFMKDQEESQMEAYYQLGKGMIAEQVTRLCVAEKDADATLASIEATVHVSTANRSNRSVQYRQRSEIDAEEALKRDNTFVDSARQDFAQDVRAQAAQSSLCGEAAEAAERERSVLLARDALDGIVGLALAVIDYKEYAEHRDYASEDDIAPFEVWNDLKRAYGAAAGGLPVLYRPKGDVKREWGVSNRVASFPIGTESVQKAYSDDGVAAAIDDAELQEYIHSTNMWDQFVYKLALSDPFPPLGVKHGVGEVIINTSLTAAPFQQRPPPPSIPKFPLRLCLIGRSFAGKSEQARRLADRFSLSVISVEEELSALLLEIEAFGKKVSSKESDLIKIGREAHAAMITGGEIQDETYVKLVVAAIHRLAEERKCVLLSRSNSTVALKASTVEVITEGEDEGGGEVAAPPPVVEEESFQDDIMGWVLDDFPQTSRQAILLEQALSGYDYTAHVPARNDRASELFPPLPAVPPSAAIIPSGIDLVIKLDADLEPTLNRCFGRRMDPETGEQYHLDSNRPPLDIICKERMITPNDLVNPTEHLALRGVGHDFSVADSAPFYEKFGNVRVVETSLLTTDGTFAVVNTLVNDFLKAREAANAKATEERAAAAAAAAAAEVARLEAEAAAEAARLEAEAAAAAKAAEEAADPKKNKGKKVEEPVAPAAPKVWGPRLVPAVSQELAAVLSARHAAAEEQYVAGAKKTFRALRDERAQTSHHLHMVRESFAVMMNAPDNKQKTLSAFITSFNSVSEDMRFDERTKAELSLRVEELRNGLWSQVETRRSELEARLAATRADGWVSTRIEAVKSNFSYLMQLEANRFYAAFELLADEASASTGRLVEGRLFPVGVEVVEDPNAGAKKGGKDDKKGKDAGKKDAKKGVEEVAAVEAPPRHKFPPVIFSKIGAALAVDPAAEEKKEDKKAVAKKDDKKGGKGGKAAEDVVEVVAPADMLLVAFELGQKFAASYDRASFQVPQVLSVDEQGNEIHPESVLEDAKRLQALHETVWYEAELLKARLQRLFDAGLAASDKVNGLSMKTYDKIQRTMAARIAAELRVVEKVTGCAMEMVREEQSINFDWTVQSLSFKIDKKSRLIPKKPAPPKPIIVVFDDAKLNSGQAASLADALAAASEEGGGREISVESFALLMRRLANEDDALPKKWSDMTYEELWLFAKESGGGSSDEYANVDVLLSAIAGSR